MQNKGEKLWEIWRPFSWQNYRYAWYDGKITGLARQFFRDIKYIFQRARYGFCDDDLFNIDYWFLEIIPNMLRRHRDTRTGSPIVNESDINNDEAITKAWDDIINKMIFLFEEASEDTCKRKNSYEDEHLKILDEFMEKYGIIGESLMTDEEKKQENYRCHFPGELPEYREIEEKFFEEEKKIALYREECKNKAFELFSKWFHSLWD